MCTRIHDNGSRQCIYVFTYELFIQEIRYKIKTVVPYNHQSLWAEHRIKSLSTILMKHLTNLGHMWPNICHWLHLPTTILTSQT